MKRNLIAISIILISSIVVSLPLLSPGFYTVHDDQQFARLYELDKSLKAGQIPPRWVEGLGFGFGYPLFVFYPPLIYYLGEVFHLAGFGFIDSIKLVFFISIFASAIAMYILVKEFWGKLPAVVSSLFYILAPYKALDIYVRGALAESFAFVWLPLILWSAYMLTKTKKFAYVLASGLFLALLMITHNLIFLPFMLILPFYLLFLIWKSPDRKLLTVNCLLSTVLAFGLSAFFWIPSLFEKKYTIVDQLLLANLADFRIHFVYPGQLWNWPWGFGGSAAGLADGISFKIGKLHIAASVTAAILSLIHLVKKRYAQESALKVGLPIVFVIIFIFSAFMTTFYSKFIWDLIPPLWYLQFPWRFLTFTALASSLLAGYLIYALRLNILKIPFSIVLICLLIFPNLKLFKPQAYRPALTDQEVTAKNIVNWDVSSSSFEYLPKGVELYKSNLGTNVVKIAKEQVPSVKAEIIDGAARINFLKDDPSSVKFSVNARRASTVRVNIFNFPGWELSIDGAKSQINDINNLKLITFNIPEGLHQVTLQFKDTKARTIGNIISLLSILALVLYTLKLRSPKYGRH